MRDSLSGIDDAPPFQRRWNSDSGSSESTLQILSIVIPCYNDEAVIRETVTRLTAFCGHIVDLDVELIFINDGSQDKTWNRLRELAEDDPRIKLINFTRNFGHQVAITAGIDASKGDAVVVIDSDLQDPPEIIAAMIDEWRKGYDVVYGTRSERLGESALRLAVTRRFYRLLNRLSDVPIPVDTGDFRLITRNVVDALRAMPERDRFVRGMVSWIGFRQTSVRYSRAARYAGESHYSLAKLLHLAADAILSFSTKPLQISAAAGIFSASLALIGIVYTLLLRLLTNVRVEGWASTMIAILFIGGIQLISLGILGGYIGRIYNELKQRPLYVVDEYVGFDREGPCMSRSPVGIR